MPDAIIRNHELTFTLRFKPKHYFLSLYDLEFGGNFTYQGTVDINLDIKQGDKWSGIVLNSYQLKVHSAELKLQDGPSREAKNISYDDKSQRVTLSFGDPIEYTGEGVVSIKFEGIMNNVRI